MGTISYFRTSRGAAAENRKAIRAQERLPVATATTFVLGYASNGFVPTTVVATATYAFDDEGMNLAVAEFL